MTRQSSHGTTRASIVIRGYEPNDAAALVAVMNQPSVYGGTLQVPFQSVTEAAEKWSKPDPLRKHLVLVLDGQPVAMGTLGLSARPRMRHVGQIGMVVSEAAQGRRLGGKLLDALVELGERWYGVLRFELDVWVDNVRAIRLYRSRGFTIEGIARAMALRDGQLVDAFAMARVAENLPWPRVTAESAAQAAPPRLPPTPRKRTGN